MRHDDPTYHDDSTYEPTSAAVERDGSHIRDAGPPGLGARRGAARWLRCARCGGDEFTVVVPVSLDVARPYAHDGRVRAADDYEAVTSLADLGVEEAARTTWTCTACGDEARADALTAGPEFDPLVEIYDAAPGAVKALACGRCGNRVTEIRRTTVEQIPVTALRSGDDIPALIEDARPLGVHVVSTVAWCPVCGTPVDRFSPAHG